MRCNHSQRLENVTLQTINLEINVNFLNLLKKNPFPKMHMNFSTILAGE